MTKEFLEYKFFMNIMHIVLLLFDHELHLYTFEKKKNIHQIHNYHFKN